MNKKQYNDLINEAVRLQKLVKRHSANIKTIENQLKETMIKDKLEVYQADQGIVTYKENTSNKTIVDLMKLFKKIKIGLFIKVVSFNATQAKPLLKSGELDSKILDSVTTTTTKTTPAKIKIQAL